MISPEQYAKHGGLVCPNCECAGDIEGEEVTVGNGVALQSCYCGSCGASWTDEYTLTGYDQLELDRSSEADCDDGDDGQALASAGMGTDEDYGG
jgi:hypothetical protein